MNFCSDLTGFFIATIGGLTLLFFAYLFGAYSYSRNLWPIELLQQIRTASAGQSKADEVQLSQFDSVGRLTSYPEKTQVDCPVQGKDTGVLLILGQSNAANHAEKKFTTRYPDKVVNYFDGKCYVASSPLLGATGQGGEFITLLADLLISKGTYKNIVIIDAAVEGSPISRWIRHGDLNESLIALINAVQTTFHITDVIWHQGETDAATQFSTTAKVYVASFQSLVATLTEQKVRAPIFISIATRWCQAGAKWTEANPVALGQRMLIDNQNIFFGVDTDKLVGLNDRYDTCHFSESGQVKTAEAFADSIRAVKRRGTPPS